MLIDHIGEFIPQSPVWFRYIGRLSAPLFFYCSTWGFYYTSNRKRYLLRLYILGLLMSLGNIILSFFVGKGTPISNNIFVTIFLSCLTVFLFEAADHWKIRIRYIAILLFQQLAAFILCAIFAEFLCIPRSIDTYMLYYGYGALFGSIIFCEGSILFVFFFIIMYLFKEKPMYLSVFTGLFSIFLTLLIRRTYYMRGPISYLVPFDRYQGFMILVIPFFFLYNGKKGKNYKWFYYLFYPLHIWGLYIAGCMIK